MPGSGGARLQDFIILGIAVTNVSTASILVRLAGVHGFVAASWRLIFSSILTGLLLLASRGSLRLSLSGLDLSIMAVSGVALALHFDLWMVSLFHLSVGPSVTIVDSYPALLAVVGWRFFRERYSAIQLAGAAVAMAGVALLALHSAGGGLAPQGGNPVIGSVLALAGMVCVAVYFSIGKSMRRKYDTLSYTLVVYSIAALVSTAFTLMIGEPLVGYSHKTMILLLLLAVLPMLGGHTLINFMLGRMSLLASTVPILGEPVGASILAWIILHESLDPLTILFMALTIFGIALTLLGERR